MQRVTTAPARKKRNWKSFFPYYLMMVPGLIYLLVNNYMPMFGIVVAFKKVNYRLGILGSQWNGLNNFEFLFASGQFGTMVRNTVLYNLAFIMIGTVLSITVAILLNSITSKAMSRVYQTSVLLPYLMSYVVISYLPRSARRTRKRA